MLKRSAWILAVPAVALTAVLLTAGGAVSGGQEEETAGNCLSFPVIWGEGSLPLRGSFGVVELGGAYTPIEGVNWYWQRELLNSWQAESKTWIDGQGALPVTWIDWGDNLESQDWKATSKVRVETVLYKDLDGTAHPLMTGYEMLYLFGSGQTEMWGSNGNPYVCTQATVYSDHARLTIQRINPEASLEWDPVTGAWFGLGVLSTDFNGGAWETEDGPGGYSAEINLPGKVIYGFNWDVLAMSDGIAGTYRITFSLDPAADHGTGNLQTDFDAATQIKLSETQEEAAVLLAKASGGGGGRPPAGGKAFIDPDKNITWIDVKIKAGGGGRR
jgi:hypothetical protein